MAPQQLHVRFQQLPDPLLGAAEDVLEGRIGAGPLVGSGLDVGTRIELSGQLVQALLAADEVGDGGRELCRYGRRRRHGRGEADPDRSRGLRREVVAEDGQFQLGRRQLLPPAVGEPPQTPEDRLALVAGRGVRKLRVELLLRKRPADTTTTSPITSEIRAPYRSRLKMSRPS